MQGLAFRRLAAVLFPALFVAATAGFASEIISVMRNVNAVGEHQGFRINPAYDSAAPMGSGDLAPVQAFEILRPQGRPVTLGRLYTSCTCIQLEAPKRSYGPDERAILQLRNTHPTPLNGQVYAIYVQITSPVHTTLRFDTFVQSNSIIVTPQDRAHASAAAQAEQAAAGVPAGPDATATVADAAALSGSDIEVIVPSATPDEPEEKAADAASDDKPEADDARADAPVDPMDAFFAEGERPDAAGEPEPLPPPPSPDVPETGDAAGMPALPLPEPGGRAAVSEQPADGFPLRFGDEPQTPPQTPAAVAEPARAAGARKPAPVISLVTIGVRDMARAIAFYEALGWRRAARNKYDQTAFFQLDGQVLALYPLQDLMKEQNMAATVPAPGGITLAIHAADKEGVRELYRAFLDAGGSSLKAPTEMPSGAVTCYVADPDGNPWEISWVPQFRLDADGKLWLP